MAEQTPWSPAEGSAPPPAPPIPRASSTPPFNRRGGVGVGIILIALGIVFLFGQFVPGLAWWQMWPLFIILLGGIQMVTPDARDGWGVSRVMDGVGTVLIGLVLLGNTTGFISWGVWWTLLTLWPVFLIAFGIAIVGRALNQSWIRMIAPVVIWAALAYAVATALTGVGGVQPIAPFVFQQPAADTFNLSEPVGSVRSAKLIFEGGAGDIAIAGTSSDLVSAKGSSPFGAPGLTVKRTGDTADVVFGPGDQHAVIIGPGFAAGKVDVGMSDSVVWDATLNTGATNLDADFSNVKLSSLTLKTGVSNVDLRLGPLAKGDSKTPIVIKAGVSSVTVRIPKGVESRVMATNGLSSLDVSGDLKQQTGGAWVTPGYSAGGAGYEIRVESGVGNVSIRTY
ncbi:MAG TPA: DUF5668 domain-containing protein [Coriobacteriia bacterium]